MRTNRKGLLVFNSFFFFLSSFLCLGSDIKVKTKKQCLSFPVVCLTGSILIWILFLIFTANTKNNSGKRDNFSPADVISSLFSALNVYVRCFLRTDTTVLQLSYNTSTTIKIERLKFRELFLFFFNF